ncbi:MAG: hypothetical protein JO358_17705 [Alphaproteobacteria bacterium]|nr:hypothetical protein [Alphaproteobacteria bacterium]
MSIEDEFVTHVAIALFTLLVIALVTLLAGLVEAHPGYPRISPAGSGRHEGPRSCRPFLLTPGQAHDLTGAEALLPQMAAEVLIADKAYDVDDRGLKPLASAGKSPSSRPGKTKQASSVR